MCAPPHNAAKGQKSLHSLVNQGPLKKEEGKYGIDNDSEYSGGGKCYHP